MKRDWMFVTSDGEVVKARRIIGDVAELTGITVAEILGRRQKRPIVIARHTAIHKIRNVTRMSLPAIGALFGRDHTTIMHACRAVEAAPHLYPIGEGE